MGVGLSRLANTVLRHSEAGETFEVIAVVRGVIGCVGDMSPPVFSLVHLPYAPRVQRVESCTHAGAGSVCWVICLETIFWCIIIIQPTPQNNQSLLTPCIPKLSSLYGGGPLFHDAFVEKLLALTGDPLEQVGSHGLVAVV